MRPREEMHAANWTFVITRVVSFIYLNDGKPACLIRADRCKKKETKTVECSEIITTTKLLLKTTKGGEIIGR